MEPSLENEVSNPKPSEAYEYTRWCYDFSRELKLRYCVDISDINSYCDDNFVKSIRMSPTGCSFLFSCEDGTIHYTDISTIDFWGVNSDTEDRSLLECSKHFSHTEIVYDFDW